MESNYGWGGRAPPVPTSGMSFHSIPVLLIFYCSVKKNVELSFLIEGGRELRKPIEGRRVEQKAAIVGRPLIVVVDQLESGSYKLRFRFEKWISDKRGRMIF